MCAQVSRLCWLCDGTCIHHDSVRYFLRRCGLNTCIQYLSGLPGFASALLDPTVTAGPLTRGVARAVEWSVQKGAGVVGDLSDLVEVLKRHPATGHLVQEGPRCFCNKFPASLCHFYCCTEQSCNQYATCRRVMLDVDTRELVFTVLSGINAEMVQGLKLLQDSTNLDMEQVRAPQVIRNDYDQADIQNS